MATPTGPTFTIVLPTEPTVEKLADRGLSIIPVLLLEEIEDSELEL